MSSTWRSCPAIVSVLSILVAGGFASSADAGQAAPAPPETAPAQKAGWWLRPNAPPEGSRMYWRFGAAPNELGAPVTWAQGASPDALDAPPDHRMAERVFIAALAMPPTVPVSFCLFFGDRPVAFVEFTQETTLEVDRGQTTDRCDTQTETP